MKGRPVGNKMRKQIGVLLDKINYSYGYEIYKLYKELFGDTKIRNIYYNLKKGVLEGEYVLIEVKKELGNYTWGGETERVYYTTGPYVQFIELTKEQKDLLNKIGRRNISIDWKRELRLQLRNLYNEILDFQKNKDSFLNHDKIKLNNKLLIKCSRLKKWGEDKISKELYIQFVKQINKMMKFLE